MVLDLLITNILDQNIYKDTCTCIKPSAEWSMCCFKNHPTYHIIYITAEYGKLALRQTISTLSCNPYPVYMLSGYAIIILYINWYMI